MKRVAAALVAVLAAGGLAVSVARAGVESDAAATPDWLATINEYRASASLGPVSEDGSWSAQATQHARYRVANGTAGGGEDPAMPFASPGGAAVAPNAEVAVARHAELSGRVAVERWMSSPLHALGVLRPRLERVGFGSWRDERGAGGVRAAAVLDVLRGLAPDRPDARPLVRWPGPGSTVPLTRYAGDDQPDLLSACGGYVAPAGLPILVLFPTDIRVARAAVAVDGEPTESCLLDEHAFEASKGPGAAVGRALLAGEHAVVVVPRRPLPVGARVDVSLETSAGPLTWRFRTTAPGGPVLPAER